MTCIMGHEKFMLDRQMYNSWRSVYDDKNGYTLQSI